MEVEKTMMPHHARRLLKLADFMEAVDRKKFDILDWYSENRSDGCGTVACVLGWACTIPAFKKAGLSLSRSGYDNYVRGEPKFTVPPGDSCRNRSTFGHDSWAGEYTLRMGAGQYFFGLSRDESEEIFLIDGYTKPDSNKTVTPKMAAKKIRSVVKRHYPELLSK